MSKSNEKYKMSFSEITEKINNLGLDDYDIVVAIGSGGIVPASLIAYKLQTELKVININYRDEVNNPKYEEPKILDNFNLPDNAKNILLVDDVSVTGNTINKAKETLKDYNITTLVMKGKGDFVLFPDIKSCVEWPWKNN